jgi:hypothetical protein
MNGRWAAFRCLLRPEDSPVLYVLRRQQRRTTLKSDLTATAWYLGAAPARKLFLRFDWAASPEMLHEMQALGLRRR